MQVPAEPGQGEGESGTGASGEDVDLLSLPLEEYDGKGAGLRPLDDPGAVAGRPFHDLHLGVEGGVDVQVAGEHRFALERRVGTHGASPDYQNIQAAVGKRRQEARVVL